MPPQKQVKFSSLPSRFHRSLKRENITSKYVNAGHCSQDEAPQEVNAIIKSYLQRDWMYHSQYIFKFFELLYFVSNNAFHLFFEFTVFTKHPFSKSLMHLIVPLYYGHQEVHVNHNSGVWPRIVEKRRKWKWCHLLSLTWGRRGRVLLESFNFF